MPLSGYAAADQSGSTYAELACAWGSAHQEGCRCSISTAIYLPFLCLQVRELYIMGLGMVGAAAQLKQAVALLATVPGLVLGKPSSISVKERCVVLYGLRELDALTPLAPRLQCVGLGGWMHYPPSDMGALGRVLGGIPILFSLRLTSFLISLLISGVRSGLHCDMLCHS